jgi:hypothetical protein
MKTLAKNQRTLDFRFNFKTYLRNIKLETEYIQSGFATLLIVWMIVLGASIVLISTLASRTLRYSTFEQQKNSKLALSMVKSCNEAALLEIKNNTAYTGTQIVTISGNNCTFTVINGGGPIVKTITTSSTVLQAKRSSVTNLTSLTPALVVGSYSEQ